MTQSGIIASSYVREGLVDRYLRYLDKNSLPLNFSESSLRNLYDNSKVLFNSLDLFYLFGAGESTSMVNFVNPRFFSGSASATGLSFSANEMKGDAVSGFVDTGFNPSVVPPGYGKRLNYGLTDACRGVVITSPPILGSQNTIDGIATDASSNAWTNSSGTNLKRINTGTSGNASSFIQGGTGVKVLSRFGNDIFLYDSLGQQNTTNAVQVLPNSNMLILARYDTRSSLGLGCYFLGKHISFELSQIFQEAYNQFRTDNGLTPIA